MADDAALSLEAHCGAFSCFQLLEQSFFLEHEAIDADAMSLFEAIDFAESGAELVLAVAVAVLDQKVGIAALAERLEEGWLSDGIEEAFEGRRGADSDEAEFGWTAVGNAVDFVVHDVVAARLQWLMLASVTNEARHCERN